MKTSKMKYIERTTIKLQRTGHILLLVLITISLCFQACKKEINPVLPGGLEETSLNFYLASDVLRSYAKGQTAVFIDDYINNPNYNGNIRFPYFGYNYPQPEYPVRENDGAIIYAHYQAGDHKLMFADTTNAVILDTLANFPANSTNSLYLADVTAPQNAPVTYTLLNVTEDRAPIPADKIGVRFIHLGPDAGSLTCSLIKANGSAAVLLSQPLDFKQVSDYQYLDVAGNTDAIGLINFRLDNPSNHVTIHTAIPSNPGKKYVIIVDGFSTDQQRQIVTGKNADGSKRYATVNIPGNLKAEIRRSY